MNSKNKNSKIGLYKYTKLLGYLNTGKAELF